MPSCTIFASDDTYARYGFCSLIAHLGEAGGGDGLAVALVLLVGHVEGDAAGQFGELDVQHVTRAVDDVVTTGPGRHATEHEHVRDLVEVGKVRHAVAEVRAERVVDLLRAGMPLVAHLLHDLELLGQPHVGRRLDARQRREAPDRLLREVLRADPEVAGPLVDGRIAGCRRSARTPAR